MSTELATTIKRELAPKPSATFGTRGIVIGQYDELVRFSQTVANSGLAPKGMEKPESVFVAVQMGLEVGLPPMAALQNIAVINGRPAIWGDAQLAVCRGTGEMEIFEEWYEVKGERSPRNPQQFGDDVTAVCRVKREGGQEIESAFSVADAKRANLWGKAGPWTQYPARMLRNRARSFALRDAFGDALKGFKSVEEVRDLPEEREVKPLGPVFTPEPETPALLESQQPETASPHVADESETTNKGVAVAESAAAPVAESETLKLETPAIEILRDAMLAYKVDMKELNRAVVEAKLAKKTFERIEDMPEALVKTLADNWSDVLARLGKEGK